MFSYTGIWAPKDPESNLDFFPKIADSMTRSTGMCEKKRLAAIQHEVWRVAKAIQRVAIESTPKKKKRATAALRGELT